MIVVVVVAVVFVVRPVGRLSYLPRQRWWTAGFQHLRIAEHSDFSVSHLELACFQLQSLELGLERKQARMQRNCLELQGRKGA